MKVGKSDIFLSFYTVRMKNMATNAKVYNIISDINNIKRKQIFNVSLEVFQWKRDIMIHITEVLVQKYFVILFIN